MTAITLEVLLIIFTKVLEASESDVSPNSIIVVDNYSGVPSKLVQCKCPQWCDKQQGIICLNCSINANEEQCLLYHHIPNKTIILKTQQYFLHDEGHYCVVELKMSELHNNINVMSVKVRTMDGIKGVSMRMGFTKDLTTNSVLDCHDVATPCVGNTSDTDSRCVPGWTGPDCRQACPDTRYGLDCRETCQCQNKTKELCGTCSSGCAEGWNGQHYDFEETKSNTTTATRQSTTNPTAQARVEELSTKSVLPLITDSTPTAVVDSLGLNKVDCRRQLKCGIHNISERNGRCFCACLEGFYNSDFRTCKDTDECTTKPNICDDNTCVNTFGSYRCVAKAVFFTDTLGGKITVALVGAMAVVSATVSVAVLAGNIFGNVGVGGQAASAGVQAQYNNPSTEDKHAMTKVLVDTKIHSSSSSLDDCEYRRKRSGDQCSKVSVSAYISEHMKTLKYPSK